MATAVTPTKNTTVTISNSRGPPKPIDTPRITADSTAQSEPYSHVLGPSATTQ
jgi:hypothetical protein